MISTYDITMMILEELMGTLSKEFLHTVRRTCEVIDQILEEEDMIDFEAERKEEVLQLKLLIPEEQGSLVIWRQDIMQRISQCQADVEIATDETKNLVIILSIRL